MQTHYTNGAMDPNEPLGLVAHPLPSDRERIVGLETRLAALEYLVGAVNTVLAQHARDIAALSLASDTPTLRGMFEPDPANPLGRGLGDR